MKTLLAIFLLLPSLSWGSDIKYLVCFNLDDQTKKVGLKSMGLKLNTNTKEFTSYHIRQNSDGEYLIKTYEDVYSQTADHIKLNTESYIGYKKWLINRKSLEWRDRANNPPKFMGKCGLRDTEQSVIKNLKKVLKDNLDLNQI